MIITVTNQKGGVAKSTTVATLLACLTKKATKRLLWTWIRSVIYP